MELTIEEVGEVVGLDGEHGGGDEGEDGGELHAWVGRWIVNCWDETAEVCLLYALSTIPITWRYAGRLNQHLLAELCVSCSKI
jgi:hypothetical protein